MVNSTYPGHRLHQIGPYVGKLRPELARRLVEEFSQPGEKIWDPFCGSGTIPLECRLLSRRVVASDINSYACFLTRAKLHAPVSKEAALAHLSVSVEKISSKHAQFVRPIPSWVQQFYHRRTLQETLILLDDLVLRRQYFIVGCLLSILHHQRPGFLSYPSSYLIPYLRDRLFPRDTYPKAYAYRDPVTRLKAKIERALSEPPERPAEEFRVLRRSALKRYVEDGSIDAVITSPPYMDALDYSRDNRLRLWFLGVNDYRTTAAQEIGSPSRFRSEMSTVLTNIGRSLKYGGACVLVVGDVSKKHVLHDLPSVIIDLAGGVSRSLVLETTWAEDVPMNRRSVPSGRANTRETILVFRKVARKLK